jgi:hypothetical protein
MTSGVFKYDDSSDYATNYANWRYMNNDEKMNFGEDVYPEEVAQRVFNEMYGAKLVKQKLLGRKRK